MNSLLAQRMWRSIRAVRVHAWCAVLTGWCGVLGTGRTRSAESLRDRNLFFPSLRQIHSSQLPGPLQRYTA
jgi:hypothetical protein